MSPVEAEARIAFIKERRHGKLLPAIDFPGRINASSEAINARRAELVDKMNRTVCDETNRGDLEGELERSRCYCEALEAVHQQSMKRLQEARGERELLVNQLQAHQENSWNGQTPEAKLLSHTGVVSFSFGGGK
ncbi:MAG: hypothetical protein S4CHLAM45_07920 [Chlamydiales bacterium]|nr:hypothetical protein [Chlamydiales bacterium]MCH9619998.1 hypothetical protein [Chlamydiales bacterium]MCH9622898.1 hypothetical protein [Chlamydiales bacterium]